MLQRMRLLVENVKEMVAARMPDNSLQMLFTGFRLPSPLGESFRDLARPELADLRKKRETAWKQFCRRASWT